MLPLLIKTRIRYYRNYLRYHFDKRTLFEIALIFLVLLLLTFRSPADIGYNFKWTHDEKFPRYWANFFSIFLPIFYILSEALSIYTLRPSQEWSILGALPFTRRSISNYYLFRHLGKTLILIFIGCLPFWLAFSSSILVRIFRFFVALGILFLLQLFSFIQAYRLRNPYIHRWKKIIQWLLFEIILIGIIVAISPWLRSLFSAPLNSGLLLLLFTWILLPIILALIQKNFILRDLENKIFQKPKFETKTSISFFIRFMRGFYTSVIMHDILFLWRQKRSSFLILILSLIISALICIVENNAYAAFIALLFLETLFSFLLIKTVLTLFERDVQSIELTKSLSVSAASLWSARWFLVAGFIGLPMVVPILIILTKFGINPQFILFGLAIIIVVPALLATLFCNSGFGLFPHVNLSNYIITTSIMLMFLFWFFMPIGTLIILAVMIFWIRKSQRHFQHLEI